MGFFPALEPLPVIDDPFIFFPEPGVLMIGLFPLFFPSLSPFNQGIGRTALFRFLKTVANFARRGLVPTEPFVFA